MSLKQVAVNTAIVFATLTVVYLLWIFRLAIVLFILSLAVTAATRPYVEFLKTRGLPRGLALILTYLVFIGIIIGLVMLMGGYLAHELQLLADNLARTYDRIWLEWPEGNAFQQAVVQQLPAPARLYESFSPDQQSTALQSLLGITLSSASVIGQFGTILILSIYWGIDQVHFERLWLSVLPVESRARSRDIWRSIEHEFGIYVRSEVIQSFFAGVLLFLGLWAIGIDYPALLALFGALAWIIPWLGGILAVAAVTLAGLSQGILPAAMAAGYAILVLIVLEFFVEPRVSSRRQYSSLLSILLIIALVEPFGLMGFIVAPPLAAAIELVFRYNLRAKSTPMAQQNVERITQLREKALEVREMMAAREEAVSPQTESMIQRLEDLVERAESVLEKDNKAIQKR
jgi:predicted PurR-regulated permease PerM